jgi:hypothetical protein
MESPQSEDQRSAEYLSYDHREMEELGGQLTVFNDMGILVE